MTTRPLSLTVNGKQVGPVDVPDDMMMQDFLHEYLNLTGSRMGCGEGVCHACTVILENPDGWLEEQRTPDGVVTHDEYNTAGQLITATVGYGTDQAQTTT